MTAQACCSSGQCSTNDLTLADLRPGQSGTVTRLPQDAMGMNLAALGIVKGVTVSLDRKAPLGDPRIYSLLGYRLSLREEDARKVGLVVG